MRQHNNSLSAARRNSCKPQRRKPLKGKAGGGQSLERDHHTPTEPPKALDSSHTRTSHMHTHTHTNTTGRSTLAMVTHRQVGRIRDDHRCVSRAELRRLCTWYAKQKPTARSAEDAQQSCRLIIAEPPTRATKTLPPLPPSAPRRASRCDRRSSSSGGNVDRARVASDSAT